MKITERTLDASQTVDREILTTRSGIDRWWKPDHVANAESQLQIIEVAHHERVAYRYTDSRSGSEQITVVDFEPVGAGTRLVVAEEPPQLGQSSQPRSLAISAA